MKVIGFFYLLKYSLRILTIIKNAFDTKNKKIHDAITAINVIANNVALNRHG